MEGMHRAGSGKVSVLLPCGVRVHPPSSTTHWVHYQKAPPSGAIQNCWQDFITRPCVADITSALPSLLPAQELDLVQSP